MNNNVVQFDDKRGIRIPVNLLSLDEIEQKYKIKYNAAYQHIVINHEIPYYKLGRIIRVDELDFLSLFQYMGVE